MFFTTTQNLVGGLFLWLGLTFAVLFVSAAAVAVTMVLTDHDPSDVRRALAVRTHDRKRAKALAAGEELPPEPDPTLVLMPAIMKVPGAAAQTYGNRECKRCYNRLSTYWPEDVCLECLATGRVKRDAITGAITNR